MGTGLKITRVFERSVSVGVPLKRSNFSINNHRREIPNFSKNDENLNTLFFIRNSLNFKGKYFGQNSLLFLPSTISLFLPRFLVLNNRKPFYFFPVFRIFAYFIPFPGGRYWPKYLPLLNFVRRKIIFSNLTCLYVSFVFGSFLSPSPGFP